MPRLKHYVSASVPLGGSDAYGPVELTYVSWLAGPITSSWAR